MTNYASNRMTMVGPDAEICRFIDSCCVAGDMERTFQIVLVKAIPPPNDLLDTSGNFDPTKHGSWTALNWGVPSVETERAVHRSEGRLEVTYDSPYGPPFILNGILAERFPEIDIRIACVETGNDYGYTFHAYRGAVEARESGADEVLIRIVMGPDATDIKSQGEIDTMRAGAPARLEALRRAARPDAKRRGVLARLFGRR